MIRGLINYAKTQSKIITLGLKSGTVITGRFDTKLLSNMGCIIMTECFEHSNIEIICIPVEQVEYISYPKGGKTDE